MYQFTFRIIGFEDSTITVMADDYHEAEQKIVEMKIPKFKIGLLELESILETYDDALYFPADFEVDESED